MTWHSQKSAGSSQNIVDHSAPPSVHTPRHSAGIGACLHPLASGIYLSRVGSSRPLDIFRSMSAQLQATLCKDRGNRGAGKACLLLACEHHGKRALQSRFLIHRWCRKCAQAMAQASQRIDWQLSCRRQLPLSKTPVLSRQPATRRA